MTIHKYVGYNDHWRGLYEIHETIDEIIFIFEYIEGISLT